MTRVAPCARPGLVEDEPRFCFYGHPIVFHDPYHQRVVDHRAVGDIGEPHTPDRPALQQLVDLLLVCELKFLWVLFVRPAPGELRGHVDWDIIQVVR